MAKEDLILTEEMQRCMQLATDTEENVFVTGKAGTGKTTFLKYLIEELKGIKNCIVAAPTGIAAINAGGVTLHSLFTLPFGPITPGTKLHYKFTEFKTEMLLQLDLLIIDEVSMVRADVIDAVDRTLRWVRETDEPFGGVQVIMFGDLFQLPPVVKADEKAILKEYYNDFYFFNANVFKQTGFHVVELNRVFRQTDKTFVDILNHIRDYSVTSDDLDVLSELRDKSMDKDYSKDYIHICTHRNEVDAINESQLGEATHTFETVVKDKFPASSMPCSMSLPLRVGARVMTLINNPSQGYYNGSLGTVLAINTDKNEIRVKLDRGLIVTVEKYKWANTQFELEGDTIVSKEIGSCTQFPLALAWAITIHKSQGLTFDKVVLHISRTFCPGQLYVAFSRCRTLEGIACNAYITKKMIIPDYALTDFVRAYTNNKMYFGR